ncbi:RNase adapter RapZ [Mobilicoccus massiliensis]|uniref:RNase adapter RapZ n=1 Tax=Mobilicoccus massiliensis TaxID=1522310 RepID=UPI0009E3ABC1|nr:RNase adapter RapZ [Mobilicoccus massiliensis]
MTEPSNAGQPVPGDTAPPEPIAESGSRDAAGDVPGVASGAPVGGEAANAAEVARIEPRSESEARSDGELIILTGMSGAGRSTAVHAMEDLGWYVVDNLPPRMLPQLADLVRSSPEVHRLAAVVDVRTRGFFAAFTEALAELQEDGFSPRVVFIDASDESLVRRFESVRRPHPLQGEGRLLDGIQEERRLLAHLRSDADLLVDTSGINVHQLTAKVREILGGATSARLRIAIVSFGFKYGVPLDADTVFDMRFLPNPYWIPELRPHTGLEAPVAEYVFAQPEAEEFIDRAVDLMEPMLAGYLKEGRRYITLAVGCTGGKHRSVAVAERLAAELRTPAIATLLFHRDLGRE